MRTRLLCRRLVPLLCLLFLVLKADRLEAGQITVVTPWPNVASDSTGHWHFVWKTHQMVKGKAVELPPFGSIYHTKKKGLILPSMCRSSKRCVHSKYRIVRRQKLKSLHFSRAYIYPTSKGPVLVVAYQKTLQRALVLYGPKGRLIRKFSLKQLVSRWALAQGGIWYNPYVGCASPLSWLFTAKIHFVKRHSQKLLHVYFSWGQHVWIDLSSGKMTRTKSILRSQSSDNRWLFVRTIKENAIKSKQLSIPKGNSHSQKMKAKASYIAMGTMYQLHGKQKKLIWRKRLLHFVAKAHFLSFNSKQYILLLSRNCGAWLSLFDVKGKKHLQPAQKQWQCDDANMRTLYMPWWYKATFSLTIKNKSLHLIAKFRTNKQLAIALRSYSKK